MKIPRYLQERMQLRTDLLEALLSGCSSTSSLAHALDEQLTDVRWALLYLRLLGLIKPVMIAEDGRSDDMVRCSQYLDLVWELTPHALDHQNIDDPRCNGCMVRRVTSDTSWIELGPGQVRDRRFREAP